MPSETVSGELRQARRRTHQNVTINVKTCTRRTKQVTRVDGHQRGIRQRNWSVRQGHFKINPLWQEILDQKAGARQGGCFDIAVYRQRPRSARGRSGNGQVKNMPTGKPAIACFTGKLHAVRAGPDCGQGQPLDRFGLTIAQKGRCMNRITRAVDTAFGCQEGIHRPRRFAAFYPSVGKVKGRVCQGQEHHVIFAQCRCHHRGFAATLSGGHRCGEMGIALCVRCHRSQNRVGTGNQLNLDPVQSASSRQGAHENMHPVCAVHCGHAEIG